MTRQPIHQCGCAKCKEPGQIITKELHAQLNLFLSSLDENQRQHFLGMESMNPSYGGDQELEKITGTKATIIAKARWAIQVASIPKFPFPYLIKTPSGVRLRDVPRQTK
jgi:hypothetical protein